MKRALPSESSLCSSETMLEVNLQAPCQPGHSDSNPLRKIMTQSLKFGLLLALGGRTNLLSYHNWFIRFFVMVKSIKMAKNDHF